MTPDDTLPPDPTLLPHTEPREPATWAEQGPPPADLAERPAPDVPRPSEDGLNAAQVSALLGEPVNEAAEATDANRALAEAEGDDPDSSES